MRDRCRFLGLVLQFGLVLGASSARAGWRDVVEVGVTLQGLGGSSYSSTPDVLRAEVEGVEVEPVPYEGWWGASGGAGLGAEARAWHWLGLELGLILAKDNGDEEMNQGELHGENIALHMPFVVKFVVPVRGLRPLLLAGVEVVVPMATRATYSADDLEVTAHADTYTLIHTGLGFEVDLPIEGLDIRVPFVFHLGVNPAASDDVGDKASYSGVRTGPVARVERIDFNLAFDAHVYFTTGLTWFFR